MKTILIDFDNVLHSYTSGWNGGHVISDPPHEGALEWLEELMGHAEIQPVIFTSRMYGHPAQTAPVEMAIRDWLVDNGLDADMANSITITSHKKPAVVTLDDRAIRFEGKFPSPQEILEFEPWRKTQ